MTMPHGPSSWFHRIPTTLYALSALVLALGLVAACPDGNDPYDCPDGGCVGDGDLDLDSDSDSDGDGDGDTDTDTDTDTDSDSDVPADGDPPPGGCVEDDECILALNFNVCCPCIDGMARSADEAEYCIMAVDDPDSPPARPDGCGLGCHPETCPACPAVPNDVECEGMVCVARYPGACVPGDDSCGEGRVCALVDGEARCVDDPNECYTDEDCVEAGYECRDWLTDGVLWCYHPESSCIDYFTCPFNHFCEDPDGNGIFECVDGSPDCRVWFDVVDCPPGQRCSDPDGDGRGTCVAG